MSFNINQTIKYLLGYGRLTGLITEDDEVYSRNLILDCLGLDSYEDVENTNCSDLEKILSEILDFAYEKHIIEDNGPVARDLFDTKIMNCLLPRPSEVRREFRRLYEEDPKKATDWFYKFSQDTDYIRRYRIKKDMKWVTPTEYGDLDITINLSKPEKASNKALRNSIRELKLNVVISEILPICGERCQTLALYGLDEETVKNFVLSSAPKGIDRIVELGRTLDFSLTWDGFDLIRSMSRKIFTQS